MGGKGKWDQKGKEKKMGWPKKNKGTQYSRRKARMLRAVRRANYKSNPREKLCFWWTTGWDPSDARAKWK
ncbi:hypothetical protein MAPG_03027 [Magnaporthiopsis poae ATCC 64411]|uniref:Uncharacterized protein n=1 Tax=Magnaporthiopsis poae (strain ATCC 64411 / 73-15) TaxID=644358 RepID=A0A0C4DSY3_MAGP6|nr:hypothetical protein MAPG_03027 [Magnaporthiopsis poae ATCC 64411]